MPIDPLDAEVVRRIVNWFGLMREQPPVREPCFAVVDDVVPQKIVAQPKPISRRHGDVKTCFFAAFPYRSI